VIVPPFVIGKGGTPRAASWENKLSGANPRTTVDKELDELLYTAIQTKHLVRFKYKGQERVAEPHDYGIQKGIVAFLLSGRRAKWKPPSGMALG
jgi:hypothetical protein